MVCKNSQIRNNQVPQAILSGRNQISYWKKSSADRETGTQKKVKLLLTGKTTAAFNFTL